MPIRAALLQALGGGWWNRDALGADSVSAESDVPYAPRRVRRLLRRHHRRGRRAARRLIVGFNLFKAHMIAPGAGAERLAEADHRDRDAWKFDDWQPQISAVGTLRAVRGVDVTTESRGPGAQRYASTPARRSAAARCWCS